MVQVYSDGSTYITQRLGVSSSSASVNVPLLSPLLLSFFVTDQSGSLLSYKPAGSNVTVYTLGATGVILRYDTVNLTSKIGAVWTLGFVSKYNATVVLPKFATLISISGTSYTLSVSNQSTIVTIPPGTWKVKYGVPISTMTSMTATGGGGWLGGVFAPGGVGTAEEIGVAALVVGAGVAGLLLWRRRRGISVQTGELRPDDIQVLNFIKEKGGRVLEPEIRIRFVLPKTSAWRQIKRLERMGYVKVTKVGSQNQIELVKKEG